MIVNVILALLRSLPQKRLGGGAKERRNLGYLGDFGEYCSNRGVSTKLPSRRDVEGPDENAAYICGAPLMRSTMVKHALDRLWFIKTRS